MTNEAQKCSAVGYDWAPTVCKGECGAGHAITAVAPDRVMTRPVESHSDDFGLEPLHVRLRCTWGQMTLVEGAGRRLHSRRAWQPVEKIFRRRNGRSQPVCCVARQLNTGSIRPPRALQRQELW